MKTNITTILKISILASLAFTTAQAATLATTANNATLTSATNWTPSQTPVSGMDTLNIGHNVTISSTWTIASGQAINHTGGSIRLANGGHLTVEAGGNLNSVGFFESGSQAASGRSLTILAGANVSTTRYITGRPDSLGLGGSDWTTNWVANAAGISTLAISSDWQIRGSSIDVDLTNYDASNGSTLTLATYGTTLGSGPFNNINITGISGAAWTEGVHYTFDIGDGSADSITLTIVPEPSSSALLGLGALALTLRRRK